MKGRKRKAALAPGDLGVQLSLMPEHEFDYVDRSVERVILAWEAHHNMNPDRPMLLAFSGGKDSVSLYGVCKKAAEKLDLPFTEMFLMQYNVTNVDPPELVRFVREFPEKVHMHHPRKTMWQLIVDRHLPPLMKSRYCCAELKEVSGIRGGVYADRRQARRVLAPGAKGGV